MLGLGKRSALVLLCVVLSLTGVAEAADTLKAFIGARGHGAMATGGRGGDVYRVTSLLDDGSQGTLRDALESATGPRTVVFETGGIIHLDSRLKIRTDKLTLAGQTAPGGGITLAGYPLDIVDRSDIIVRYMRFRVGDYNARDPNGGNNGNGNQDLGGAGGDAINVENCSRVILDHVSASWSMDETVDLLESNNVTLQYSIISEGLYNSFHPKGPHSRGLMMFAGMPDTALADGGGGYTVYQNLLAHNNMRNPVVGGQMTLDDGQNENDRKFMHMHFENNVVYNWGQRSGHTGRPKTRMNYINNYLIAGPSTTEKNLRTAMREENDDEGEFYIYFSGNYMDSDKNSSHDGQLVGGDSFPGFESGEFMDIAFQFSDDPVALPADAAYQEVVAHAGASLVRDEVDRRVIADVVSRTGGLIDSQNDVGGLGSIARGVVTIDTDKDGMPDSWELDHGLEPTNADDRNGTDLDLAGYTNLELYLDSLVNNQSDECGFGRR